MKRDERDFHQLVSEARAAYARDREGEDYREIVCSLGHTSDRTSILPMFPLTQGDRFERSLATSVLARFMSYNMCPDEEVTGYLLETLTEEKDDEVLQALLMDMGDYSSSDIRVLTAFKRFIDYPNDTVRWTMLATVNVHDHAFASEIYIAFSSDENPEFRFYATDALANEMNLDSPEIRAALQARLNDENEEVRAMALKGLALRQVPPLESETNG